MAKLKNDSTFMDGTVIRDLINSKSTFSGSYNDLTNKPTIPTIPSSLPANGGNADTVDNFHIWQGTQAEYDAITTKNSNTIYLVKEG